MPIDTFWLRNIRYRPASSQRFGSLKTICSLSHSASGLSVLGRPEGLNINYYVKNGVETPAKKRTSPYASTNRPRWPRQQKARNGAKHRLVLQSIVLCGSFGGRTPGASTTRFRKPVF